MLTLIEKLLRNWKTFKPANTQFYPHAKIDDERPSYSFDHASGSCTKVFLPLCSVSGDGLIASINELDEALQIPATHYEISLLGPEGLYPEFALTLYALIQARPHAGQVTIRSLGSLMNADVLVWLAGDHRTIRSNGCVRFESPLPPRRTARRQQARSVDPAYDRVFELITEHLPPEFAGREVYPGELSEWALIEQ